MILYFEDMKTTDAKEKKQLRELSDQELEKVTGGLSLFPEECKDPEYRCSHVQVCKFDCAYFG